MNWNTLKPGKVFAPSTIAKRNQQLAYLCQFLKKLGLDPFTSECYKTLTMEQIEVFMRGRAEHTIIGYLDALEVMIIHYLGSAELVRQIMEMRKTLKEKARIVGTSVQPTGVDTKKILESQCQTSDTAMKILGDFTLSKLVGVRLSDLIDTLIYDDSIHSFLDLSTGNWHIRTDFRKGEERVITIPDDLLAKLNTYQYNEWLLTDKGGLPFSSTRISYRFKTSYGITYGSLRKGACDSIHEKNDVSESIQHAKEMGHSLQTELLQYVKPTKPVIRIKKRKDIYIMRGLPGSGKSTRAHEIKTSAPPQNFGLILSTDDFFTKDGVYKWDLSLCGKAHLWNQDRCKEAMENGLMKIIIDNTNLDIREMLPYIQLAEKHGYEIYISEPNTDWKYDVDECYKKCIHHVDKGKIRSMHNRWQPTPPRYIRKHPC